MPKISIGPLGPRVIQSHATPEFTRVASTMVSGAFKLLLETKHLYQSIELSAKEIADIASAARAKRQREAESPLSGSQYIGTVEDYDYTLRTILLQPWRPNLDQDPNAALGVAIASLARQPTPESLLFLLPLTITTYCKVCRQKHPFNPSLNLGKVESSAAARGEQWFMLSYQCQGCKTDPVRFLVRRSGVKLRVCGRDPFEEIQVSEVLPIDQRKHFSNAMIAHHAGQTLAGIFQLRVFIEQFWRSLPVVVDALNADSRLSGDAMGELYNSTLPVDLKARFPSLSSCYSSLSQAIHFADAKEDLFEKCCADIIEHFEAKRLFRIT